MECKVHRGVGPSTWGDAFSRRVDGEPVHFVRPADTQRPSWAAYGRHGYLGTLHARTDSDGLWHVQSAAERHSALDDAVRVLRRPSTWSRECAIVGGWARELLSDPALLMVDVQTSGLEKVWAVQIGALNNQGRTVVDEVLNPCAPICSAASALHGITVERVAHAPTFTELLPTLTRLFAGRRCVAYNMAFHRGVFERELLRHHRQRAPVQIWLDSCQWEDAIGPVAVWKGLWSARRSAYRRQPLGGTYDAVTKCQVILQRLQQLAAYA
ncbi:3'-5' exonuclease [Streptomyces sp. NPDC057445]|uniref:3'-5' exonuclease n=1 Tax=Streptomyces sp. NPDC057445 TaxID=3346136 RepID=UPI0036BB31E3